MSVLRRERSVGLSQQLPAWQIEIDASHPLARGLVGAWMFNGDGVDLTGGGNTASPVSGAGFGPSARGTRLKTGSTGYATVAHNFLPSPAMTVVAFVTPASFPNDYNTIFSRASSNSYYFFFDLHVKSTGQLACYVQTNGSVTVYYDGGGANTLATGVPYCLGMSYDSVGGLAGYVNGVLDGSAAAGGALATGTAPYVCYVGSDVGNLTTRNTPGLFGPVYHYNRSLSAAEHAQLAAAPFCMLRQTKRRAFGVSGATIFAVTARGGGRSRAAAANKSTATSSAAAKAISRGASAAKGASPLLASGLARSRIAAAPASSLGVSARSGSISSGRASLASFSSVIAAARSGFVSTGMAAPAGLAAIAARTSTKATTSGSPVGNLFVAAKSGGGTDDGAFLLRLLGLGIDFPMRGGGPTSAGRAGATVIAGVAARAVASSAAAGAASLRAALSATGTARGAGAGLAMGTSAIAARSSALWSGRASLSGITFVAAATRAKAVSTGRAAASLLASLSAQAATVGTGRSAASALAAVAARASARSAGSASLSGITFVSATARAGAVSAARAAATSLAALAARASARGSGTATAQAAIAVAARGTARSAAGASLSGISFVIAAARAGAVSAGRAVMRTTAQAIAITGAAAAGRAAARAGIAARAAGASGGRGAGTAIGRIAASALTASTTTGRASLGAIATVTAAARAGSVSAGRAGSSLAMALSSRMAAASHGTVAPRAGIAVAARLASGFASRTSPISSSALYAAARAGAVSAGRALALVMPGPVFPAVIRTGRRAVAAVLARLSTATALRRSAIAQPARRTTKAGVSMPFDPIRAGDTDAFQFDLSPWFPTPIVSGTVVVASQPGGWTFAGQSVVGSVVTVYATAPIVVGWYVLLCTASDGSAKLLTKEERILVVP